MIAGKKMVRGREMEKNNNQNVDIWGSGLASIKTYETYDALCKNPQKRNESFVWRVKI